MEKLLPTLSNIIKVGIKLCKSPMDKMLLLRAREAVLLYPGTVERATYCSPCCKDNEFIKGRVRTDLYSMTLGYEARVRNIDPKWDIVIKYQKVTIYNEDVEGEYVQAVKPRICRIEKGSYRFDDGVMCSYAKLKKYLKTCISSSVQLPVKEFQAGIDDDGKPTYYHRGDVARFLDDIKEAKYIRLTNQDTLVDVWGTQEYWR